MPFTVQQLIEDQQEIIKASPELPAKEALELMLHHDFSQLPVIDENNKLLGIVTSDSILHALNNFGVQLSDLHVSHAIAKARQYAPEDDLFVLLEGLKDVYAVLIVHNDGTLKSIVTSYDTTEFFRKRAEDIMYVEDIETTIKEFIRTAFDNADDADQNSLDDTIAEIISTDNYNKFYKALQHYLGKIDPQNTIIDKKISEEVFARHLSGKKAAKTFSDLTLNDYIQLILHKSKWPTLQPVFHLERGAVLKLLESVRDTRNMLAHFHDEITPSQRKQLHDCADWLERCRTNVLSAFQSESPVMEGQDQVIISQNNYYIYTQSNNEIKVIGDDEIIVMGEKANTGDSRYAPLAIWLQKLPPQQDKIFCHLGK